MQAHANTNPYAPGAVAIRSRDDVVVTKYLTDALAACRKKSYDEVRRAIEAAQRLAPSYAEVYRIEGWVEYCFGNYAAARNAYELAIELDPKSPVLRYWYAGFLLRGHEDPTAAIEQLKIAQESDPEGPEIRVEFSRALSYLFQFDEAEAQLQPVLRTPLRTRLKRIAYDGWLQIAGRRASFCVHNGDYLAALDALEELIARFRAIPPEYLDRKIIENVTERASEASRVAYELRHSGVSARAESTHKSLLKL
ncbi:unnamed protein product, partial [marine sediment metagenome]